MQRATFSKHERLRGRLRVQEVATTGRSVHEPPFKLVGKLMALPTDAPAQIAFAVPKRNLPLAVHRNRVKRLLREAYRINKHRWYGKLQASGKQCAWLIVFQGKAPVTLAETELKISRALDRWLKQHG
ncbi:MAG: ribonuclease P protein component [Flavobacteriales bacterium]|nr:ribonuclease P protein component [Flavobacteriales bacterium]MBP7407523.1 ribonuclease P protein component [Flavobacteriales bacterium]